MDALGSFDRLSIKSGHGVGKSCLAACAALWFKFSYWPSVVITTAPTERQVKEILWREIRHRKAQALQALEGKPLTMKLDLGPIDYMIGISTNDVQQMQGFHSPNMMVIVDEANGYPEDMFDALEGLLSGGERKVLLQIGNPVDPSGAFFRSFSDGMTWNHTISCLDHPNVVTGENIIPGAVTREWVDRIGKLWGKDSSFWQSRVLGEFPRTATDIIINLWWIETAQKYVKKFSKSPRYMGHDPGEYGDDPYVWYIGDLHQKIHIEERYNIEPAESIGITKRLQKQYGVPDQNITIDGIGSGATIYSVLRSDGVKCNRFVASGTAKNDKEYEDCNTEAYFGLKKFLNPDADEYDGYALHNDNTNLAAELCTRKYQTSRYGRLMLQPKEQYRKKFKRSPNHADAMALCYYPMIKRSSYGIVTLPNVY